MGTSPNTSELIAGYYDRMDHLFRTFLDDRDNVDGMNEAVRLLKATRTGRNTIFLVGNGGSSAVAEHIAIDLTKNAGLKALAVSGTPMLTTFSNDYGYENVFAKAIEIFAREGDILVAISSSGTSRNITNACRVAKEKGLKVITLSGFKANNPLRSMGHLNFWIDSEAFGFLETLHGLILHYINDSVIGSEVYMIR
ncbi:MAG: SIS domain-containing protein [Pseudomonadota bacterium]